MRLIRIIISIYLIGVIALFGMTLQNYTGNSLIYIIFTFTANLLLVYGFTSKALFFDAFIGLFFWLGFWVKFSLRIVMHQVDFDLSLLSTPSIEELDLSLIVSSIGFAGLLTASFIRSKFFRYSTIDSSNELIGLFAFYKKYRNIILIIFFMLLIFVAVTNMYYVIYQRGKTSQLILPFGINGVYKWLLLFGLSSMVSIFIKFEIEIEQKLNWKSIALGLIEPFVSNTAMLSRGMVLNSAAMGLGGLRLLAIKSIIPKLYRKLVIAIIFIILFITSVTVVNYMRAIDYHNVGSNERILPANQTVVNMSTPLFIDRWVGIEAVVAVTQYKEKGYELLKKAWNEKHDTTKNSFFDDVFIKSPYRDKILDNRYHFITLPGLIAFLYYQGSMIILYMLMIFFGIVAASLEIITYSYAGKNLILASLIGQVIAYRYSNFGYVPIQTYMLFISILGNILILVILDNLLRKINE